jgi:hypothetical protein
MIGLDFDPAHHIYRLDGERLPSVTGVLKFGGLVNFDHIPPGYAAAARYRGTVVHRAIHLYNEHDLDVDAFRADFPQYAGYLDAWLDFCVKRRFEPLVSEHRVVSRRHRVCGTLDALGLLDHRAVLLDFKTGKADDVAADLQTAAYLLLALESSLEDETLQTFFTDHPVVRRYAVQLRKNGTFVVEPFTEVTDTREFIALTAAFHIVAKHRPRAWRELDEVAA